MKDNAPYVELVLRAHPAGQASLTEVLDVYSGEGRMPWANVHIDLFHDPKGLEVYNALNALKPGEGVRVRVEILGPA